MPTFDLIDRNGRNLGQVDAETGTQAALSEAARQFYGLGLDVRAVPAGSLSTWNAGEQLLEDAEARLAEAFGRLGLSDRATAHALVGRGTSPMDRARTSERLAESHVNVQGHVIDTTPLTPIRPTTTRRPQAPKEHTAPKQRGIYGWAGKPVAQVAAEVEIAGALIRAGYDPNDVAYQLGLPLRHTGKLPVTVQGGKPAAAVPAPEAEPAAASEAARLFRRDADERTTESGRTSGDSELVELRETERLEAALQRGFGLTDIEARHAGEGRRR